MEGGEERRFLLARLHHPSPSRRIGCGTNTIVEKVGVVAFEGVVLTGVGGVEMDGRGKDGVADGGQILFSLHI